MEVANSISELKPGDTLAVPSAACGRNQVVPPSRL